MRIGRLTWRFAASLALLFVAAPGCAPAYHDYACGCVPYGYCPLPPLPYETYCGCPTPIASQYVGSAAPDVVIEAPESAPESLESPAN